MDFNKMCNDSGTVLNEEIYWCNYSDTMAKLLQSIYMISKHKVADTHKLTI